MTTPKHDPWALLTEAHRYLKQGDTYTLKEFRDLYTRIDAALAEHGAGEKVEVEVKWFASTIPATGKPEHEAIVDENVTLRVWQTPFLDWFWSIEYTGEPVVSLDEAKSAAIRAARGWK